MSNIPANIAASVSQAMVQQHQVARQRDAVSNADREHARKLRELLEKHVHEVEDSEEVDPNRLRVDPEHRENGQGRARHHHHQQDDDTPQSDSGGGHIDIEA